MGRGGIRSTAILPLYFRENNFYTRAPLDTPSSLHRLRIGNTGVLHPLTMFSNVEDAIEANNLSPLALRDQFTFSLLAEGDAACTHTHTHTYRCLCTRSQMGTNWSLGEGREGRLMNSPSATNNSQWWRCHR